METSGGRTGCAADDDFDAFYAASSRGLLSQLYGLTGDWAEAQDCLQEAYARAWQRWSSVRDLDAPVAWVRVVAFRLARSRWRRTQQGLRLHRANPTPRSIAGPSPDAVAIASALRRLPEAQRRALVLHHLGDLSVTEVARETGVPEGTVKARLSRGRAALAGLLGDDMETSRG
ncbi:MAG: SigE family polymerase sigma factor [Frankiales bacterium]|nr:SigE family polymerase sigma factor [Frankiales bacterium]